MTASVSQTVNENQEIRRLLVLDDEAHICSALKRLFRADGYVVHATSDIDEAFGLIESEPVDVIISDQRMPACKGTDFLKRVQDRHPETVRMILSGHSDVHDVAQAMDVGAIYKFLTKPWDDSLLRANVREAFSRARALKKQKTDRLTDALTGLPTAAHLESVFSVLQQEATSQGGHVCLVAVRPDQLSDLLVGFGRQAADRLLKVSARSLVNELGSDWVVARHAEGFLVLGKAHEPKARFERLTERLAMIGKNPVNLSGEDVRLTFSAGGVFDNHNDLLFDKLVERANAAAITAQHHGGNNFRTFDRRERQASRRGLALETELRGAVDRNEFAVFFQPQVMLETGQLAGMEALIRWPHAELGSVSPAEFVPIAERLGLMGQIGRFVMNETIRNASLWLSRGWNPGQVSVNVSPRQLPLPGFYEDVVSILEMHGFPACSVVLEITETEAVKLSSKVIDTLHRLSDLGIEFAIDDFGTGYANLNSVNELPITKLKIDKSLIPRGPENNDRAERLFCGVVSMAKAIGLTTIVEGVETVAELAIASRHGCEIVQGYFFSPPVQPAEIERLLEATGGPNTRRFS